MAKIDRLLSLVRQGHQQARPISLAVAMRRVQSEFDDMAILAKLAESEGEAHDMMAVGYFWMMVQLSHVLTALDSRHAGLLDAFGDALDYVATERHGAGA